MRGKRNGQKHVKNSVCENGKKENEDQMANKLLDAFFPDASSHQIIKDDWEIINESTITQITSGKIVKKLQKRKALGINSSTGVMFKRFFKNTAQTFTELLESYVHVEHFSSVWKTGKVTPIPKRNNESTHKFVRPITQLSIAGKSVEKLFVDRILDEMKSAGHWRKEQFGFTKGKSTEVALVAVMMTMKNKWNVKNRTLFLSLDIAGALDNIGHDRLFTLSQTNTLYRST